MSFMFVTAAPGVNSMLWKKTYSEPIMCAELRGDKEESTGKVLQELAKQPDSVLDPNRWYKILEVFVILCICSLFAIAWQIPAKQAQSQSCSRADLKLIQELSFDPALSRAFIPMDFKQLASCEAEPLPAKSLQWGYG